ncbi:MAG TPA: MBL fold metallo-hydrolase [Polyangia bacterium]
MARVGQEGADAADDGADDGGPPPAPDGGATLADASGLPDAPSENAPDATPPEAPTDAPFVTDLAATDYPTPDTAPAAAADGPTETTDDLPIEVAIDLSPAPAPTDADADANDDDAVDGDAGTATDVVDSAAEGLVDAPPEAPLPPPPGPRSVGITWASIANVYLELGSTAVLINGYITRLPGDDFFGGGGGLAFTHTNYASDEPAIKSVMAALGGAARVNWLFTGHSHWDHSFDTATWSRLTGAPIVGPRTTCFQARAEGIPAAACTAVAGGEKLSLGPGVTVRVIRWNHSGDSVSNPEQHNPVELSAVPQPDNQGRLRAGVAEDFPNGGGSRGFLFTIAGPDGPYSFFFEDSASADDLKTPIVIGGVNFGAPFSNLQAALADASLTGVDLWIGTGGAPVAKLVVPILHPKAHLPIHWDGLFGAFKAGAPGYSDNDLRQYLSTQDVALIVPAQYMDKWSLSPTGIVPVDNRAAQHALGL